MPVWKAKRPFFIALAAAAGLFVLGACYLLVCAFGARDVTEGAASGVLYVSSDVNVTQYMMPGYVEMRNRQDADLQDSGYGILCNNVQLALCRTSEDAQWVLDSILSSRQMEGATASFVQVVTIQPSYGKILGREEALLVLQSSSDTLLYIVKDGETVDGICSEFHMSQQEYCALNVSGGTAVLPGQIVTIGTSAIEPLKVKNVMVKTETKAIAYTTQTVSDDTLFKGQSVVKQAGVAGEQTRTTTVTYIDGKEASSVTGDFVTTKQAVPKIVRKGTKAPADAATGPKFRWPVSGPISSPFGSRWGKMHEGIDIAVSTGTSVKASAAGVVKRAFNNGGYGLFVEIDHGNGWITRYGHNSKLLVKAGDTVSAGQVIALSGSTGNSTGPHVHFEIRKNGVAKNPEIYLP